MPKNPPVSDRFALTEIDTAPEYSPALDEFAHGDWALALLNAGPVVHALDRIAEPKNISIPRESCVIVTCHPPTAERNWIEFKRTPPETKRLASEHGVWVFRALAEHLQPEARPSTAGPPSLNRQFASALKLRDTEDALDVIFDAVDSALLAGRFKECDRALASIDVEKWPTDLLGGLLSITAAASPELPARANFFERTRRAVIERGDDTPGLLDGLE